MPTVSPASQDTTVDPVVFWFRYKTELIVGILILILAVLGFLGYRVYVDHRDSAGAEALAAAHSAADYQRVIDEYPGTPATASAYLFKAENQRQANNFSEANTTLQTFVDKYPQHQFVSTARLAMAANLESMGKTDEALSTLQRLTSSDPKNFVVPMALLSQVHLLKAKGKTTEARQLCEKFLTEFRESPLAQEASRQLRLLKPTATPTPAVAVSVVPQPSVAPTIPLPSNPAPTKKP
jgi:predicted negative regulator of RcsB-dependent stress response